MYFISDQIAFPHPATVKDSGILAIGGDLSHHRLLLAYNYGIFPWYNPNEPIIWWCPTPRFVIFPSRVKVAKSMNTYFNQHKFRVTFNEDFSSVIRHCQKTPRQGQNGTWLTDDMVKAYEHLFKLGYIRSVEVWEGDQLVGGLYGVEIGKMFFGESMFSLRPNASKFGFIVLARNLDSEGFKCIDCQQPNPYLESLGGEFIAGDDFHALLRENRVKYGLY